MTRILFLTDLHGAERYVEAVVEREREVDLVLVGGDITSFGTDRRAGPILDRLVAAYPVVRAVHGNVDLPPVLALLEARKMSLHGRGEALGSLGLFGSGGSNITPMGTPVEFSESTLAKTLAVAFAPVQDAPTKILVSHCPPKDTSLDRMFAGKNVGSASVRAFLEQHEVTLCLCGHIHEAKGIERVGSALAVNPGALCTGAYAVVDIVEGRPQAELRRVNLGPRHRVLSTVTMVAEEIVGYARFRLGR
jgi:Icc-related predicted phosphoesterase